MKAIVLVVDDDVAIVDGLTSLLPLEDIESAATTNDPDRASRATVPRR